MNNSSENNKSGFHLKELENNQPFLVPNLPFYVPKSKEMRILVRIIKAILLIIGALVSVVIVLWSIILLIALLLDIYLSFWNEM